MLLSSRFRSVVFLAAVLHLAPGAGLASTPPEVSSSNGSIVIYDDAEGYNCLITSQGSLYEFYVRYEGPGGVNRVDLRITGMPQTAIIVGKTMYPGAVEVGDPLGAGSQLSFPACDNEESIVLYHFTFFQATPTEFTLNVENVSGGCPTVILCDDPTFTGQCASGWWSTVGYTPSEPFPADGQVSVPQEVQFTWTAGSTSACGIVHGFATYVYLGTDPDPPLVWSGYSSNDLDGPFNPGILQPHTTYYWRVVNSSGGATSSPVWSFRTSQTVAVEEASWQQVKRLYR